MELTYLNILYISLTIFTIVIGTLLTLILIKILKILNTITTITTYVNDTVEKIVLIMGIYRKIPELVKEKVKNFLKNKK